MKKSTKRYTTLTVLALTSAFFLGACGNQKEASTTTSSSKVTQTTKSSASSAKAKADKKTQASSTEGSTQANAGSASVQDTAGNATEADQQGTAPATAAEDTSSQQAVASDNQAAATSAVDPTAMLAGDFTSAAGTYQNDLGDTITVSPDGSVSYTFARDGSVDTSSQLFSGREQDGGYVAGFAHNDGPYSDPIFFDSNGQIRFGSDMYYGQLHVFNKVG